MEREATLLVLALAICGPLCVLGGQLVMARGAERDTSGARAERVARRRVWLPLLPAAIALALLVGWALDAPDDTEDGVALALLVAALPGAVIAARAVTRAIVALVPALHGGVRPLVATVGLVRPRIVVDPRVAVVLDADQLAAARAHEDAHARHRDPLHVWLAQLATDLQWPAPAARARFTTWLHALEVARDEEARVGGVAGDDLAGAIVEVAKLARAGTCARGALASLVGHGELLRDRIARLLAPVCDDKLGRGVAWLGALGVVATAVLVGYVGGDALLRCVPGVSGL